MTIPDVLADASGLGTPVDVGSQAPPPGLPVPSDFSTVNRFNIVQQAMNQSPVVSETPGASPDDPGGVPTNMWGRLGLALMLGGAGLRGDVLPAISVMQQLEQRKQQTALIAEKKRQQEEQKRTHNMGLVNNLLANTTLPNAVKLDALDKLRREIPWAGTMADGLKEAHLQNFNALRKYIPDEMIQRVTSGQATPVEIAVHADYAMESYKIDLKEQMREQAYNTAVKAEHPTPSQKKLIEEREADLAVKKAKAEADQAQASLHRAQAAQPQGANKELAEFMSDLESAGITPQSKEGQSLLKIRAERKAKGTPLVNLDMGQDANKAAQKQFMEKASETYQQLKTAPVQLKNLEDAKALIPKARGFMGPFGETKLEVAKFLNNSLGMSIDPKGINNAEELRTRIFQNVLENLKKMDAQPSQYQQIIMMESLGKLGSDPNALVGMIDAYAGIIRGRVGLYNQEVASAEQRGVKFPYDPIIKLETTPAAPKPKDIQQKFKKLGELMK